MRADQESSKQIYTPGKRWANQLWVALLVLLPYGALRILRPAVEQYGMLASVLFSMFVLSILIVELVACLTVFPFWVVRRLRSRLITKVQAVYGKDPVDAPMVGFSPGSGVRLFNCDTSSDFGILLLRPGSMTYLGDTLTFQLVPGQVEEVRLIEHSFWGQKIPRLLIGWRDKPDSPCQGFALEAWDANSLWESRRAVRVLLSSIEAWRLTTS